MQTVQTALQQIQEAYERVEKFEDIIDKNSFSKFSSILRTFKSDAKSKESSERLLRIGIIGQIKRGKSSLLNTLFFDSKNILPQAATPMTAALTLIRYAKEPYALIEFYTKEDLQSIEREAKTALKLQESEDYNDELSEEQKACIEIYEKTQSQNFSQKLGTKEKIENGVSLETLFTQLYEYVGSSGIYTPIVKSLELGVNIESMRDIEIVDTPGTNDPVVSRGRVTQEFIGQCDVVFLLSKSSSFLDSSDMELLAQSIPQKGVSNIYLIGSLFDSVLRGAYSNPLYKNVMQLIKTEKANLTKRAEEEIEKISQREGDDVTLQALQKALLPIFISSMCDNIALHFDKLSQEEAFVLNSLNEMYGDNFSPEDLRVIGNTKEIKEKLTLLKGQKEEILKNALSKVIDGATRQVDTLYKEIYQGAKYEYERLKSNDIEQLEAQQIAVEKQLQSAKASIEGIFESYAIDVEKRLKLELQGIQTQKTKASHVEVQSGSYDESYDEDYEVSNEVSTSSWYNPFSWGSTETITETHTRTRSRTIYYKYADTYDVVESLESFVNEAQSKLYSVTAGIINADKFRKELQLSIVDIFDISDDNFDPKGMKRVVKNAVNKITIPSIEIESGNYINEIRNSFSSKVEDSELYELKEQAKEVSQMIMSEIKTEVLTQIDEITKGLTLVKENFLPQLLKDSQEKLEQTRKNMANLEESLSKIENLMKITKK